MGSQTLLAVLVGIIYLGDFYFVNKRLKISLTFAPLVVILSQTLILYIFALFNLLNFGFYTVIFISLALALMNLLNLKGLRENIVSFLLQPAVLIFGLGTIFAWILTRGTQFHIWDEFSHWGVMFRHLNTTHALPDANSCVLTLTYPPFTSLYQYFIGRIIWSSESNAYFAQSLLVFAGLLAIFDHLTWKKIVYSILILVVAILAVIGLDYSFLSLYSDLVIGVLFGVGLAHAKNKCSWKSGSFYLILLVIAVLPLTKPLSAYYSYVIVLIVIAIDLTGKLMKLGNPRLLSIKIELKKLFKIEYILLIIVPGLTLSSWNIHTQTFNKTVVHYSIQEQDPLGLMEIPQDENRFLEELVAREAQIRTDTLLLMKPYDVYISMNSVLRTFTNTPPYRTRLVIDTFLNRYTQEAYKISDLTIPQILLGIFLLFFYHIKWMYRLEPEQRLRIGATSGLVGLGLLIYSLLLLFSYIFYFFPREGVYAPTLLRYLGTYFLGWLLLFIADLENYIRTVPAKSGTPESIAGYLILGIFAAATLIVPPRSYLSPIDTFQPERREVKTIFNWFESYHIPQDQKVFHIWQEGEKSYGLEHYMMRYYLCPAPSNIYGWRLGNQYHLLDEYTYPLNQESAVDFFNELGYSYVLISKADDNFWKNYRDVFHLDSPVKAPRLYQVFPDRLELVGEFPKNQQP